MSKRIHKSFEKADTENEFEDMHSELNSNLGALWQDIYDLNVTPDEAFTEVAEGIRAVMAEESG